MNDLRKKDTMQLHRLARRRLRKAVAALDVFVERSGGEYNADSEMDRCAELSRIIKLSLRGGDGTREAA